MLAVSRTYSSCLVETVSSEQRHSNPHILSLFYHCLLLLTAKSWASSLWCFHMYPVSLPFLLPFSVFAFTLSWSLSSPYPFCIHVICILLPSLSFPWDPTSFSHGLFSSFRKDTYTCAFHSPSIDEIDSCYLQTSIRRSLLNVRSLTTLFLILTIWQKFLKKKHETICIRDS